MRRFSFDFGVFLILIGLGGLLVVLILAGNRVGMPAPDLILSGGSVGVYGPVGLSFAGRIPRGLEEHIRLVSESGSVALRLDWEDRTAWLRPDSPLQAGQKYTLRLESGLSDQDGRRLRAALQWEFQTRQPGIAYLRPVEAPDVWRSSVGDGERHQLTSTGGQVFDFAVSPTGERLTYSAAAPQGGLDLWETSREGGQPRLLLACGADRCAQPAYAPRDNRLVYIRSQASGIGLYRPPAVWVLDLDSLETRLLVAERDVAASDLLWSPDGKFLAFYDQNAWVEGAAAPGAIRVVDAHSGQGVLLLSGGAPGSWSPDSQTLWFASANLSDKTVVTDLRVVSREGHGEARPVGWENLSFQRFGRPVWSPDGRWVTFTANEADSSVASRLWRFSPDGKDRQVLAQEPFYTYGRYRWDPGSAMLTFQRLEHGLANSHPEVVVWRDGEIIPIAPDAALPAWIP